MSKRICELFKKLAIIISQTKHFKNLLHLFIYYYYQNPKLSI